MSIFTRLAVFLCLGIGPSISDALALQTDSGTCPMACPEGWVRFGYTDSCYKLPSKPVVLDTFDNHQRRCAQMEPTAYVAVINRLREQALAMAVAGEYASEWTANASSGFLWVGMHTTAKGWEALDGSNIGINTMIIATNLTADKTPDMCLGVNPRTLGEWKARPCSDKGIALCEMPKRKVCGKAGKILPVIPVHMFDSHNFGLLFPTNNFPLLGKILNKSTLDIAITDASKTSTDDIVKVPAPGCSLDCPAGWVSLSRSPTAPCYLLPNATDPDVPVLPMLEEKCRKTQDGAHVSMVNGLVELSMWMAIAKSYYPKWQQARPIKFIQLGVIPVHNRLAYYDNSDSTGNLITTFGNPRTPPEPLPGGSWVADAKSGGDWRWVEHSQKGVVPICEMSKRFICDKAARGDVLDLPLEELTIEKLSTVFPSLAKRVPTIPFFAEVLDGKTSHSFNPFEGEKNEKSKAKYGDAVAYINCVDVFANAHRLLIKGSPAMVTGSWIQVQCVNGPVDAFKADLISYVSAWSRCYNDGYSFAMAFRPDGSQPDAPFLIGDTLAQYYRRFPDGSNMPLAPMNISHCY